jgi:ABC-2 type transport system permease protein
VNRTVFGLDLRRSRTLAIWLGVITAVYAGFMTLFYANVAANAEEFERLLEIYPRELMQAFGLEEGFGEPGVFLHGYVFTFLWPLIGALATIVPATRVAADADRGFLDIVLATPMERARYLLGSIGTQLVALTGLAIVMVAAILVADLFIEPNLPAGNVALTALHAVAFGAAIGGPATLLAVLLLDRGRAAGLVGGALVLMYLLNVIAAIAPDYEAIASLSYFHYFNFKALIGDGVYPVADSLLFLWIALGAWLLSLAVFRRRDLAA